VAVTSPVADVYTAFLDDLIEAGLLVPTGVDGLFGRGAAFVDVYDAVDRVVTAAGADQHATRLRFPPLLGRDIFERTDYLRSFPNLIGSVHGFTGGDAEHRALLHALEAGGEWAAELEPTDVVLCPAACYPLYPMSTGRLDAASVRFDVHGWCFRHEPSGDPARMQAFHQHEFVYLGDPAGAVAHRDLWVERSLTVLSSLGLEVEAVVANDPFFGRAGRMLAVGQRDEGLKLEIVAPVASDEHLTAITSANCHLDHFGTPFGITTPDGETAHSACVGFGMERIVLALLRRHGLHLEAWPPAVRAQLWP
jgi:seryl-tRNA synthetase